MPRTYFENNWDSHFKKDWDGRWHILLDLMEFRKPDSLKERIFAKKYIFTKIMYAHCCSVTKLCPTLSDPMDCSMPGFRVLHYLPEFSQIHVHWVSDATQTSHPLSPPSPPALSLSWHQSFPMNPLFASRGQSIEAPTSASVLPMNIQGWFPLGLTGSISLLTKGLSGISPCCPFLLVI